MQEIPSRNPHAAVHPRVLPLPEAVQRYLFFISTASIVSPFLHPPLWLFAPVPDECWPDQRLFPSGSVGDMGQDHFF